MIDTHAHLDALDDADSSSRARARRRGDADHHRSAPTDRRAPRALELADAHDGVYAVARHSSARSRRRDRRRPRGAPRAARAPEGVGASARSASTTSATTRRATRSAKLFDLPARRSPTRPAKPVVIHTARRTTTRSPSSGSGSTGRSSCTASRRRAPRRGARAAAGTSRSPATSTYKNADDLRVAARARAGRADPRRDGLPLPRAAARPREDERAGVRRPHASRLSPKRAAKTRTQLGAQIDANAAAASACHERSREEEARPALPGRREHPRRDRPPRRARRRRRRARDRARARRADRVSRRARRARARGRARPRRSRRS